MTVIEFNTQDIRVHVLYITLGVLVVISAFFSIISYNRLISLRHENKMLREQISHEQVQNAELKNIFYNRLDSLDSDAYLSQRGYVLEKQPQYEQLTAASSAN